MSSSQENHDRIAMLEAEVDELRGVINAVLIMQVCGDMGVEPDRRLLMTAGASLPSSQRDGSATALSAYAASVTPDLLASIRRIILCADTGNDPKPEPKPVPSLSNHSVA